MAQQRLEQIERHLQQGSPLQSVLHGPNSSVLTTSTLTELLEERAATNPEGECLVFPQIGYLATYKELLTATICLAKGLVAHGIVRGDHVGILAGNCPQYVQLLFACSHVGAALVVLNNTYTPSELVLGLRSSNCKLFFTSTKIGKIQNGKALAMLRTQLDDKSLVDLRRVVLIGHDGFHFCKHFITFESIIRDGSVVAEGALTKVMRTVKPDDVCNLQFTSGTTGNPKAALLTHNNIINNGRFIGERMRLTSQDRICCPPPLFHCFGLVLGLLAVITHGATIVFPSETFDPISTVEAVSKERCTGLHGVPAMFAAELEVLQGRSIGSTLRTGIAAGAPVPKELMQQLREKMGLRELTNTYGMTETSPATFMTFTDDPLEKRLTTVGRVMPHTSAKIVDSEDRIVPLGTRGELCVSGYALQKGYWRNPEKTAEVMRTDDQGILWMHTGDEAMFDNEGFCRITGRIKDIIIRGGENIYPLEIEERLVQHSAISQASVVGIPDKKYGEIVCAFLQKRGGVQRPTDSALRAFINEDLGHHKVPARIYWLEEGESFPQTGSAKIKKHVLRQRGVALSGQS